jgi:hypothetical protein
MFRKSLMLIMSAMPLNGCAALPREDRAAHGTSALAAEASFPTLVGPWPTPPTDRQPRSLALDVALARAFGVDDSTRIP